MSQRETRQVSQRKMSGKSAVTGKWRHNGWQRQPEKKKLRMNSCDLDKALFEWMTDTVAPPMITNTAKESRLEKNEGAKVKNKFIRCEVTLTMR